MRMVRCFGKRYFLNLPYRASGFSYRSPFLHGGCHRLGSPFQAMTNKPLIWQAPSPDGWLFGYRHPDPNTPFLVRITGCSNRNRSLPRSCPRVASISREAHHAITVSYGQGSRSGWHPFQLIISAKVITGKVSGKAFQEFFRMISAPPAGLVIIQAEGRQSVISVSIHPHIRLEVL